MPFKMNLIFLSSVMDMCLQGIFVYISVFFQREMPCLAIKARLRSRPEDTSPSFLLCMPTTRMVVRQAPHSAG